MRASPPSRCRARDTPARPSPSQTSSLTPQNNVAHHPARKTKSCFYNSIDPPTFALVFVVGARFTGSLPVAFSICAGMNASCIDEFLAESMLRDIILTDSPGRRSLPQLLSHAPCLLIVIGGEQCVGRGNLGAGDPCEERGHIRGLTGLLERRKSGRKLEGEHTQSPAVCGP